MKVILADDEFLNVYKKPDDIRDCPDLFMKIAVCQVLFPTAYGDIKINGIGTKDISATITPHIDGEAGESKTISISELIREQTNKEAKSSNPPPPKCGVRRFKETSDTPEE